MSFVSELPESPYSRTSLADVVPSLMSGLGVPGTTNTLGLPQARQVCLLLIDGLGWNDLLDHADNAPFLSSLAENSRPLGAGFPSTTATSIASIGTGLPSGQHGLVGYTFAMSPDDIVDALTWTIHGPGAKRDQRSVHVPEEVQPFPTLFERAAEAGVAIGVVSQAAHLGSGLSRAVLRGGTATGAYALGDLAAGAIDAVRSGPTSFCYAYHADLDLLGHLHGPGSEPWILQLRCVDHLAEVIADRLPPGAVLAVTADHGMISSTQQSTVDFDGEPALRDGVRKLGGEPRVRHVYTQPGATADVLATWQGILGDRAWVTTRGQAIAAGWFGSTIAPHVTDRIGDLVVAARADNVVVSSSNEPHSSRFVGHHGSLTPEEQLVPLLVHHA